VSARRVRWRGQFGEALNGVLARPSRLVLTALGAALGLASLVATLGLAQTAANQVSRHFDAIAATQVSVQPESESAAGGGSTVKVTMRLDAAARVIHLPGVVAAGTVSRLAGAPPVRAVPVVDPSVSAPPLTPVLAVTPGLFAAVDAHISTGRTYDEGHEERADRVAVLGVNAAAQLGINRIDNSPTVFIGERPFVVIGIVDAVVRHTELLDSVIVPQATAEVVLGLLAPEQLQIQTAQGAASLVAHQAPIALEPNDPSSMVASTPPPPSALRDRVRGDVNALFIVLGLVALFAGAVGIANVMLLSVLERIGEIGLRRALGATRRNVAMQFLMESGLVGFLGGLVGASTGVIVALVVSSARHWTPVLDLRLAAGAPALGLTVGILAGAFPAWRASAIEPVDALRGA
jgi:putative ABC transport system permease protein